MSVRAGVRLVGAIVVLLADGAWDETLAPFARRVRREDHRGRVVAVTRAQLVDDAPVDRSRRPRGGSCALGCPPPLFLGGKRREMAGNAKPQGKHLLAPSKLEGSTNPDWKGDKRALDALFGETCPVCMLANVAGVIVQALFLHNDF